MLRETEEVLGIIGGEQERQQEQFQEQRQARAREIIGEGRGREWTNKYSVQTQNIDEDIGTLMNPSDPYPNLKILKPLHATLNLHIHQTFPVLEFGHH